MFLLVKNFIKASLRDKFLIFWEWIFPIILIVGIAIFTRGKNYATFFLPSLTAFLLFQNVIYALPYRFAQFKENGVMRLVAEEGSVSMFVNAFLLNRIILVALQGIVFLPIGILILSPTININYLWLIVAFVVSLIGIGGLSMIAASLSKNVSSALGWAQLFYISLTAISGIFYPLENSPKLLQVISCISPLTYSRDLLRYGLKCEGNVPLFSIAFLAVFGLATIAISILIISKSLGKGYKNKPSNHRTVDA